MLLSDLKSGNISIEKARIPLSIFFSDQQKFKEDAANKKCTLQIRSEEDLWICADPKLFGIAIDTLLDNAVKFAREGSVGGGNGASA